MLDKIPQSRLLVYIVLLGCFPLLFSIFNFSSKLRSVRESKEWITHVRDLALMSENKQAVNRRVRHHFREVDPHYIDKHVESMRFLEPEREILQKSIEHNPAGTNEDIKNRLHFLMGPENALRLVEGQVTSYPGFQETLETQVHPVEVDLEDIKRVLNRIEGVEIPPYQIPEGRPQFFITEFKLDRKSTQGDNEVFSLNMKIIKRDYL